MSANRYEPPDRYLCALPFLLALFVPGRVERKTASASNPSVEGGLKLRGDLRLLIRTRR